MKRSLILLVMFILAIGFSGCKDASASDSTEPTSSVSSSVDNSADNIQKDPEYMIDFDAWNMLMVNPTKAMPEDFSPQLANIPSEYAGFAGAQFDKRALDELVAMCDAAADDGVKLTVISAYRTNDFQTYNFNRKVNNLMAQDPSLTLTQAQDKAATVVARPGTSEHQIGLAVDFNSVEDSFRNTRAYAWLIENCTDYGFILRYADDKQAQTGIIPEPWHYRYVGVENAKMIEKSGLCMEEFVEKYSQNS